ncbi:large subunit ribosomal protein L33 [Metamycoplasma subdolum]|uniref:Large ribosomal subunit protein bL33 n=1 Tax=Metamycoplasma subdolum TaxID=92407 RepID=A0A3L9ZXX4_9BACT|nr:50S ribosomal protein L33 [Metamycoplasma subdolum]RMA77563.1 large subunit ribosomal protein L33 [Metamycoplasma subdolum]WPB50357.1 50S ribosomal protein L33 [Metamycoplasma subdolum]
MKSTKKVSLACQVCFRKNYYTKKSNSARLEIKKFCSFCNKQTEHKEEK